MDEGDKQSAWIVVRMLLVAGGGWMASHKYIDATAVNEVVGALMVVLPAMYGVWKHQGAEAAVKVREVVAVNAGVAVSNLDPGLTPPIPASQVPQIIAAFAPPVVQPVEGVKA